jgi:hypothetical protein
MALWFIPVHLCVLDMRPHFPLANTMLWPGVPQRVQIVTGLGRFMRLEYTSTFLDQLRSEFSNLVVYQFDFD